MNTRRDFLKKIGLASAMFPFMPELACAHEGKKLGIALVGLGNYAIKHILPGIDASPFWELKGLVSGTPAKIPPLKSKYGIKDSSILTYENYDQLSKAKDIDVVYICLPNSMHAEYTIRAARAGKHVICEKPMATSVQEAKEMIKACDENRVKLAIGYRCHFEPFNLEAMRMSAAGELGEINFITSSFGFRIGDPSQWRLRGNLSGGGPLMDVGIYSVNAARYIKRKEPVSVQAHFGPTTNPEKFGEVEESLSWHMEFEDGTVFTGFTSYNTNVENLIVRGDKGWLEMGPAFSSGPLKGKTHKGIMEKKVVHHQTYQMNGMGPLFLSKDPIPDHISGIEGLKDMKVLMAIYESARNNGKKVMI